MTPDAHARLIVRLARVTLAELRRPRLDAPPANDTTNRRAQTPSP